MELFFVECVTCRRRLRVQDLRAVGQVLPCPKCGGLVQVTPPPDWQPPQFDLPETKVSSIAADAAQLTHDSDRVVAAPPAPWADSPPAAAPEEDILTEPATKLLNLLQLALVATLLLVAVALGLWRLAVPKHQPAVSSLQQDSEPAAANSPAVETASETFEAPAETPPDAASSEGVAEAAIEPASAEAPDLLTSSEPPAEPLPAEAPPADLSLDDEPPIAAGEATVDDNPSIEDAVAADRPAAPLVEPAFLKRAALPTVDAAACLEQALPGLSVSDQPLHQFVLLIARLAGCPVSLDVDSLAAAGVSVDVPVQLDTKETTLAAAIQQAIGPHRLKLEVFDGHAVIAAEHAASGRPSALPTWDELEALLSVPVSGNYRPAGPLSAVVERLSRQAGLPAVFDMAALAEAGVAVDEPVEFSAADDALGEALEALLAPLGLEYRLVGGALQITSRTLAFQRATSVELIVPATITAEQAAAAALELLAAAGADASDEPTADRISTRTAGGQTRLAVRAPLSVLLKVARSLAEPASQPAVP